MHSARSAARFRRHAPAYRLVTFGASRRRRVIDINDAAGYLVGLEAVSLLEQHFPDWYRQHVAHLAVTPGLLLGAAEAFLSLANSRLPLVDYMGELNVWGDPLRCLLNYQDKPYHDSHLQVLEMSGDWIEKPHPEFYGLGVQVIGWGEEGDYDPHPLDAAIWHLLRSTSWVLGFGAVPSAYDRGPECGFTPEIIELIESLKPLPKIQQMELFRMEVEIQGKPWSDMSGEVVSYALGLCENVLAQASNYEIDVIHGGQLDDSWRWGDLDELARQAEEAQRIREFYFDWREQVDRDPERTLRRLEKDFHAAARRVERAAKPNMRLKSKTLINILNEQGVV